MSRIRVMFTIPSVTTVFRSHSCRPRLYGAQRPCCSDSSTQPDLGNQFRQGQSCHTTLFNQVLFAIYCRAVKLQLKAISASHNSVWLNTSSNFQPKCIHAPSYRYSFYCQNHHLSSVTLLPSVFTLRCTYMVGGHSSFKL